MTLSTAEKARSGTSMTVRLSGEMLTLPDTAPLQRAKARTVETAVRLLKEMRDDGLHIAVPQLTVDKLPCRYAWVFKIPGAP